MPKTAEQNATMRSARRQQILEAAIRTFALMGFAEASVADIASAARAGHGTLFLYFATKEALFRAAVLEPLSELERVFALDAPAATPTVGVIRDMVRAQVAFVSRQTSYFRLTQYVLGLRDRFPDLAEQLFAVSDRFAERVVPVIEAGQRAGELAPGKPEVIAQAYLAFLTGLGLTVLGEPADSPLWRRLASMGIRLFGPLVEVHDP
jgi:TetR/AcrR family transcriptional regulator, mexJK operon transcriptional repressor